MKIRIGGRTLHFKGFQWKKMKWTIRKQMLLWLSAIFVVMFVAMNVFIVRNVQAGNEEYINDDLVVLKNNGLLYVKQILVMNNLDNNEEGFEKIAAALCEEIAGATGNPTAAYAMDGRLIEATNPVLFAQSDFDDLRYARAAFPPSPSTPTADRPTPISATPSPSRATTSALCARWRIIPCSICRATTPSARCRW